MEDFRREGWNVDACVGLAGDEEGVWLVGWETQEEFDYCLQVVLRYCLVRVAVVT